MIYDRSVMRAVSMIRQRSERQEDLGKIDKTFVDPGIINEIYNDNHQVFFGRRGTGKTHALRMLQSVISSENEAIPVYIDTRVLGSTSQYSDPSLPIKQRSLFLFKDILNEIYNALLTTIINNPPEDAGQALSILDEFQSSYTDQFGDIRKLSVTTTQENSNDKSSNMGVGGSVNDGLSFDVKTNKNTKGREETIKNYDLEKTEKVIFPHLSKALSELLSAANYKVALLIDEWSSLSADIQPYLAEFLKRTILPCNRIVVKIAAIEYRSSFILHSDQNYIGLELGSDIATAPSLDSFYVLETDPSLLENSFSEMLYRHISSELPYGYLREKHYIHDGATLMDKIFDIGAFEVLALSAEGVVRDLINIFTIAFSKVHRPKGYERRTKITQGIIFESTKQWFDRDKFQNLPQELKSKYQRLLSELLVNIKSRYFLVSAEDNNLISLKQMVDLRVVHLASMSFLSFEKPDKMFSVYNIDFGSYVSIIGVSDNAKYGLPDFFDEASFSKFPSQHEQIEKYLTSTELLQ